jgi:hypothetical protein
MVRFTNERSLPDRRGVAAGAGVWTGVCGVVRARLMFLYAAWATAAMFGGSIITQGLETILQRVI